MAAPFSFGFLGDDVEVDDDDDDEAPKQHGRDPNAEHNSVVHEKSLPAKRHSLENLVSKTFMQILSLSEVIGFVDLAALLLGTNTTFTSLMSIYNVHSASKLLLI